MAGRPTKLTLEVHQTIVEYIRAGVFSHVAASAAGISKTTFHRWMRHGEREPGIYRDFMEDVQQAQAQARAGAEIEVRRGNPLAGLGRGPGRERPGEEGWTDGRSRPELKSFTDAELDAAAEQVAVEMGIPDYGPRARSDREDPPRGGTQAERLSLARSEATHRLEIW